MKADTKQAKDRRLTPLKTGDSVVFTQLHSDYSSPRRFEVIEVDGKMMFAIDAEALFNGTVLEVERV